MRTRRRVGEIACKGPSQILNAYVCFPFKHLSVSLFIYSGNYHGLSSLSNNERVGWPVIPNVLGVTASYVFGNGPPRDSLSE